MKSFTYQFSLLATVQCIIIYLPINAGTLVQTTDHFEIGTGYGYDVQRGPMLSYLQQFSPIQKNDKSDGSMFSVVNEWKYLDFEYPTYVERQRAIKRGEFVPQNNLPLGIDVHRNRLFITTPRWKDGVPASFGTIPYPPKETSPAINPYPNWQAHGDPYNPDCSKLISVYRTAIDKCNRLWLIDSGIVNATISLTQICPPKIVAFDLDTDRQIVSYELPPEQVKQDSLHSNIVVDVRDKCEDAHVFVTDVWRFGIVVYSLAKGRSWRVTNYNFNPNPVASDFKVYGLNFQWLDGVFGMSLSHDQQSKQRVLYFHPMASFKEFMVSADLLWDESLWVNNAQDTAKYFVAIGDRGFNGQSSTSGISRNGVMFYTQVHKDNIGCWDTSKPYIRANLALLVDNSTSLIQFPNDLKVDQDQDRQGVWVMSNRLPIYLYSQLDYSDINFRILRADVDSLINSSICNPNQQPAKSLKAAIVSIEEGQCY
ncbi:protein yellow [Scaptodrosophila lebanonensis]|uniref:Protein yellow n=1 Tax=Drosophila lebanonensis TaxID=7225 RepID=A0A6J2TD85_DROLE|nr:protein yellow [Scaptodrosophila lebanonensis]